MAQQYQQTNNPTATFGEQSSSVYSLQKMLNDKYHAGLALDSKYGPETQKAYNKYIGTAGNNTPAPSGDNLPRVPKSTTIPEGDKSTYDPWKSEDKTYGELLKRSSGLVDSIGKKYDYILQQKRMGTAGALAGAGLTGSTSAYSAEKDQEQPILDQRQSDLEKVYSDLRTTAHDYTKENTAKVQDMVATMAKNHVDWTDYKKTNPENYQKIVDSLGGDQNYADALFASSIPPENIVQTWTNGTTQFQLTQDPLTGKPSIHSYDLGVKIPQQWVSEKVGTNAVIYHGPNWDPTDPSTFQMFAVDPLTGIPTSQVGGTPNDSMTPPPAAPRVASFMGLDDVNTALSDVVASNGMDSIVNAIVKNEGGSPQGVQNNPGNIKFANLPGQISSGVKATDGGIFASYASKEDGLRAIANLVQKGVSSGKTFGDFINAYTGTGGGGKSTTHSNPAIDGALKIYRTTGQIPTFGNGAAGAAMKRQFYAAVAADDGIVGDAVGNKAELAGAGAALRTQQNQYAANQTSIGTLDQQLSLVKKYSDKVDRSDSPLVNKYKLWIKGQVQGDADTAALNNIITTASNEFAKILSGSAASISGVTVSSAEDAKNMLNAALSKGQLNEVLNLMKTESQYRLNNQKSTIDSLKNDIQHIGSSDESGTNFSKGEMTDRNFVIRALEVAGKDYETALREIPAGEIGVVDNETGEIGSIPEGEYDASVYTYL